MVIAEFLALPLRERARQLRAMPVDIRVSLIYQMEDNPIMDRLPESGVSEQKLVSDLCAFPICGRPREISTKKNGGWNGSGRLCQGHARQWTRNKRLVILKQHHRFQNSADPKVVVCLNCGLIFKDAFYFVKNPLRRKLRDKFLVSDGASEWATTPRMSRCEPPKRRNP